nr:DUF2259 domain-containing protein [Marinicella sp. W31]MDC2876669.1 DUF2259 domain-containing protein [Marinicella sp. W31]
MPRLLPLAGLMAALGLSASIATAGDFATFTPLGFSDDGSVFAFEEFGVEDGSGFPYSNIFLSTRSVTHFSMKHRSGSEKRMRTRPLVRSAASPSARPCR